MKFMFKTAGVMLAVLGVIALGVTISATGDGAAIGRAQEAAAQAPSPSSSPGLSAAQQNALVGQYCVGCHDDAQKTGGLSLEKFDAAHVDGMTAAMMVGKLKAGAMPPAGMPRPDNATLSAFISALSASALSAHGILAAAPTTGFKPTVVTFPHTGDSMTLATQNKMVHTICTQCHTDQRKPGGLSFEHFDMAQAPAQGQVAEDMIAKLRAGMMPPQSAPKRPDEASIHAFVVSLEARVDQRAALHPDPGSRTFQRLNRVEYARLDPDDPGADGGSERVAAPGHEEPQLRQHRRRSDVLADAAGGVPGRRRPRSAGWPWATPTRRPRRRPTTRDATASQMNTCRARPYGTRGGLSVVHIFPADGKYVFKHAAFSTPRPADSTGDVRDERLEVSVDGRPDGRADRRPAHDGSRPGRTACTLQTPRPVAVTAGPHRVTAAFLKRSDGRDR